MELFVSGLTRNHEISGSRGSIQDRHTALVMPCWLITLLISLCEDKYEQTNRQWGHEGLMTNIATPVEVRKSMIELSGTMAE